jgi:predicted dithiol-disulfide oxidoreductase (DUF899 family)
MIDHELVGHEEWQERRRAFLTEEKAFTRQRDRLNAARVALPWEAVEQDYRFIGPRGEVVFADLFEGCHQLLVYHFMFPPEWDDGCPHCSFWADNFDGNAAHLRARDVSFAAVSRAPFEKLAAYRTRMGWSFAWYSSGDGPFNYDYGVSFIPEQQNEETFNYGTLVPGMSDREGASAFYRDDDGALYHTYSTYGRGIDLLNGTYNFIDISPLGRHEDPQETQSWVRRHDEYDEYDEHDEHDEQS